MGKRNIPQTYVIEFTKDEYDWLRSMISDYITMFDDDEIANKLAKKLKIRPGEGLFRNFQYSEGDFEW